MKNLRLKANGPWMRLASLFFLVPNLLTSHATSYSTREQLIADTERSVRTLSRRFAEILTPTIREKQLQAACDINCTAIADARSGRTVSEELADIEVATRNDRDQVSAAIQGAVDDFIRRAVRTSDPNLDNKSVANDLRQILSSMAPVQGATDQLPTTFVLHSRKSSALLVLYQVQDETMGQDSPWTVLNAYDKVGASLRHSDSTGRDMDGYAGLEVKELHSPVPDEIWLLVSGHLTGANGPNIRMRVFAFDGTKFRTVWMPANVWGSFTTRVTPHGFTVDGEYYRPNLQRHDIYYLAPDGLYVDPPTSQ